MSHYIPVETPGGTVWAEVDEAIDEDSLTLTSARAKAFHSFEEAAQALKNNAKFLLDSLETLAPQEIEVSFGIKVGAEAGIPFFGLAKASGEASYEVKLTWKADETEKKTTK